ncbi:MAG: SDR family oxidoreductase [Lentimicrobium sp.]|nr:SDR family oxidoreductase [Lentimicrobium sp.]
MDLDLKNNWFVVLGASSGFGKAISLRLLDENANVIGVSRRTEILAKITNLNTDRFIPVKADVTLPEFPDQLIKTIGNLQIHGIVINAGGPPAGGFTETSPELWQDAFQKVLFWKVNLLHKLIPVFAEAGYGRIVLIESVSVKQPVKQLVLSNSFRAAVAGMVRTLADEVAGRGITINILAPGYHETDAMKRLFVKRAESSGKSIEDARDEFIIETGTGKLGDPAQFAELASWLLAPSSAFVTGQVISVAGNLVKGIMG